VSRLTGARLIFPTGAERAGRLATDARIKEVADLQAYNPLMLAVH